MIYVILVAHFVGDFLLQSDWMALNKSKRMDALAWHVLVVALTLYMFLTPAIAWPPVTMQESQLRGLLQWVGFNALCHFCQDAITSRWTTALWFIDLRPAGTAPERPGTYDPGSVPTYVVTMNKKRHWFFVVIGLDQLLHYLVLFKTAEWWLR